jgi:hypothetical protein
MDEKEKQALIYEITERILLRMPEVIGNLIQEHAVLLKLNRAFQKDHPEFKPHLDIVRGIVEQVEMKNPGLNYKEILNKAVPEIKEAIGLKAKAVQTVGFDNGLI